MHDGVDLVRRELGVDLVVHQHRGALVAHAHAVGPLEAEAAVGRGLAKGDAQICLELPGYLLFARELAGEGAAQPEDVAALRLGMKEGVERSHRVHFHWVDLQDVRDQLKRVAVDAAVLSP